MTDNFRGKYPIQLNDRDFEIFRLIRSDGAKTSADLSRHFWNEKSQKAHAAFQRLRRLVDTGFLEHGNPKLLYLTEKAKEVLAKKSTTGVEPNAQSKK